MSSIPPAGHASLIQAHGAQQQAGQAREKESADEARRKQGFTEQLQEVIENQDADSRVHSDAEGTGSQGKQNSEEEEESQTQSPDDADTAPADPPHRLDLEA